VILILSTFAAASTDGGPRTSIRPMTIMDKQVIIFFITDNLLAVSWH
jgi:hypothetical protein